MGQITTSPVVFTASQMWQLTEFEPRTAGTTTITMVHPEAFTVPTNGRTSLTATVTAGS